MESNFITQLQLKNEKALEYVISEYSWVIKTVIRKKMGSLPHYQEECINDVLLAVWEHIDSFDPKKNSFQNWLAGVTRYKALDYVRKYINRQQEESIEFAEDKEDERAKLEFQKQEMKEEIQEILSWLSVEDGMLFRKAFLEEKDIATISEETGINKTVIYSRISRGKKKIRRHLLMGKE